MQDSSSEVEAESPKKGSLASNLVWAQQLRKYVGNGVGPGSEALTGEFLRC